MSVGVGTVCAFLRKFGCFASDRSFGAKSLPSEAFEVSCQSLETTAKRGCKNPKNIERNGQKESKNHNSARNSGHEPHTSSLNPKP